MKLEKVDNPVIEKIVHRISKDQISAIEKEYESQDFHHRSFYTGIGVGCEQAIQIIQDEMKKLDEGKYKGYKRNGKFKDILSWLESLRGPNRLDDLRKTFSAEFVEGYKTGVIDSMKVVEVCNDE